LSFQETIYNFLAILKDYQTLIASGTAAYIAWKFNSSKIKLDNESFKRDPFMRYNEKYDKINDSLEDLVFFEFETQIEHQVYNSQSLEEICSEIFEGEPMKSPDFIKSIYDYINLCSEEYYWYKKELIDEDVWRCWHRGMQKWHEYSFFIQRIVKREIDKKSSYYNPDFLDLFSYQETSLNK